MAEIDAEPVRDGLWAISREEAQEAANRWFSTSQEALFAGGDQLGYEVQNVAASALPPEWDDAEEAFRLAYTHAASRFFEDGTDEHTVVANEAEVLAFEWPDAPPGVREEFADTFPTVFYPETEVSGIERIGYFRAGAEAADRFLAGGV